MKRLCRNIALIIFATALWLPATGQYYSRGTDPASLRWRKIESEHFRVIFPESYKSEAQRVTWLLEDAMERLEPVLNRTIRNRKISVIIHNYSVESNGFVAWAPSRMEIYPAPRQNSLPFDQLESLLVHEVFHVLQMESLERGFTGYMHYLFGEQFTGAVSAMLPLWYLEGDAVLYETIEARGGRGESPRFNSHMKALYMGKPEGYGYDKMLLGSYRDYTPDLYRYGFRIAEYSRYRWGDDLWRNSIEYTARRPFLLNPLNIGLRREADITKRGLYDITVDTLQTIWESEILSDAPVEYRPVSPYKNGEYINYSSPVKIGSDSIVAFKHTLYSPLSIVLITNNGKSEQHLLYPGMVHPWFISYGGGFLTWAERRPDPRWENRSYSVIATYDIAAGNYRTITRGSRLFAPALSPDGKQIAAAKNSPDNSNHLIIIDRETGAIVRRATPPGNGYPQKPEWTDCGDEIVTILLTDNGEGIYTYSIDDDTWSTLMEPGKHDLKAVALRRDTLFYNSTISGTGNIFMRTPGGEHYRITRSRFGAGTFTLSQGDLLFADYTWRGSDIVAAPIEGAEPFDHTDHTPPPSQLFRHLMPAGEENYTSNNIAELHNPDSSGQMKKEGSHPSERTYSVSPYQKWRGLFNIHSWAPFYFNPDEIGLESLSVSPGITLLSQNDLSTLTSSAGYEYSGGEHYLHAGILWRGWYPVIDARIRYGGEPDVWCGETDPLPETLPTALTATSRIYIPMRFRRGAWSSYFEPSINYRFTNRHIYDGAAERYSIGQHYVTGRLFLSNSHAMSHRDIFPRYAQVIDLQHIRLPGNENIIGPLTSFRSLFYLPGLQQNHSIRVRLQAEEQKFRRRPLANRASFPRGYDNMLAEKMLTAGLEYHFPIAYPDLALGSLLYLKRVRGSLFSDYTRGTNIIDGRTGRYSVGTSSLSSFGGELLTDLFILRIPFPVSAGASFGLVPGESRGFITGLLTIDIQGFTLGGRRGPHSTPAYFRF